MTPLHLFVDARFLTTAPHSSHARYLRALVQEWALLDDGPCVTLFGPGGPPTGLPDGDRLRWSQPGGLANRIRWRAQGGRVWLNTFFTVAAAAARPDVLFFPYPLVPYLVSAPAVVTVHDACFVTHPACFGRGAALLQQRVGAALRSASQVIAVSGDCRRQVLAAYGIPPDRVSVVHHGISDTFHADTACSTRSEPGDGEASRPFILCVSTHEPRKNLRTLVAAYCALLDAWPCEGPPAPALVLVGRATRYTAALHDILRESPRAQRATRFVESLSDAELAALYRRAACVAVPSVCEGFGFPVLEALASGSPVVASDLSVFRELVHDAAELVSPLDVPAWTSALGRVLTDPGARARAATDGPAAAAPFAWRHAAQQTLAVIERTAHRKVRHG